MVKVSSKYAATGGWGFGHFADGKSPALKIERRKRISQAAHVATESNDLSAELKRGIGQKRLTASCLARSQQKKSGPAFDPSPFKRRHPEARRSLAG